MKPVVSSLPKPIRVLLISKQAVICAGLRMLIESCTRMKIVGEARNPGDALCAAREQQPDVFLLDINIGCESVLESIPKLLAATKKGRALVLTDGGDRDLYLRALGFGAVGVVLKEKPPEILLEAIEKVHAGEVWLEPSMVTAALGEMARLRQLHMADSEGNKIAMLTEREREVVALIGQGLKNKEIAERLFICETTVRHHLTSIFSKLDISDRIELIFYSYKHDLAKLPVRAIIPSHQTTARKRLSAKY